MHFVYLHLEITTIKHKCSFKMKCSRKLQLKGPLGHRVKRLLYNFKSITGTDRVCCFEFLYLKFFNFENFINRCDLF